MTAKARADRLVIEEPPAAVTRSLIELMSEWEAAMLAANAEEDRNCMAINRAVELYPPRPPETYDPVGRPLSRSEMEQLDRLDRGAPWLKVKGSPRLEAYDHWTAQCEALEMAFDVPRLSEISNAAFAAANEIAAEILSRRPNTAREAAIKFKVLLDRCGDGQGGIDDEGPIVAFLEDLEHLATAEPR